MFFEIDVLKNFANFTRNQLRKETPTQLFSREICEISKNTFFYKTPAVAASIVGLALFVNSRDNSFSRMQHALKWKFSLVIIRDEIKNTRKSSRWKIANKCVNARTWVEVVERNKDDPFILCCPVNRQCFCKKTRYKKDSVHDWNFFGGDIYVVSTQGQTHVTQKIFLQVYFPQFFNDSWFSKIESNFLNLITQLIYIFFFNKRWL